MSNIWHRGHRAARRADRRRRSWTIAAAVGAVVVVALGGVAAALVLADDDTEVATTSATTTAPSTTTVSVAGVPVATAPALPCRDGLTPDAPLRLWIAGDSIAYSVGKGLGRKAANTGVVAPVYESRVSSGLSTAGFFDWPDRVGEELPRLDPEVVVFVMGTNDWSVPQATPTDKTDAPAWKADYTEKVERMVAALTANGRTLYWVGPPVLRDPKQEAGVREIAAVIRAVVERSPDAEFVDAHELFDEEDGSYTSTVDVQGKKVTVRAGDGVHLTDEGADYVGDALFTRLDEQCHLKAQAVAGVKQPVIETEGSTSVTSGSSATASGAATSPATEAATVPPTPEPTAPPATATPATTTGTTPTPTPTTAPDDGGG